MVGVEDGGQGVEGGVGDFDVDGGLVAGFVPQDVQVECGEQACFELGRQCGEEVSGVGDLVQDGGVGCDRLAGGEGSELGFGGG
ncbi:MAG TPA: hypothetical protein VNV62_15870, partial [Trebonia sp.]|nr:hypothetical protein [Trebonia sp.]